MLDVAAGSGRHARLLADAGHDVIALDREVSRLRAVAGGRTIEVVEVDLETPDPPALPGGPFAGVVVTNYLHRPLLPALVAAVGAGGVLIYETFAAGNERLGRPTNPDYLLRRGELLEAVRGVLGVVAYEDRTIQHPRPRRVQRICAVAPTGPRT